jgi:phosphotriesterase-related protein
MTLFVRTVLGDIEPTELGVTYAHEHLVIDGGRFVAQQPDFDLSDVDRMTEEVGEAVGLGLRSVVDALPADAGRNVGKLAEVARRTGINVVAATGLHHERWYGAAHWSERASEDDLAELFVADIEDGIDERDYSGPVVRRTAHRAGVIKVAGSQGGPSDRDRPIFAAAAEAHRRTGAPILTHCENGTGGLEQVDLLVDHGVGPSHIVLSHVDRVVDREYHRDLVATGATLEYDGAFRSVDDRGTLRLIGWMVEDGHQDRIVLGMDAARQGYLRAYGGSPGLAYLLDDFSRALAEAGLDEAIRRLFVDNPARVFAFAGVPVAGAAS